MRPRTGSPFHPIPGPKCKTSKIGIVGAGVAGIHLAYMLSKQGFSNIIVLEKSDRFGGKLEDVELRHMGQPLIGKLVYFSVLCHNFPYIFSCPK
jgi:predicted NAD/FAD-binding protein